MPRIMIKSCLRWRPNLPRDIKACPFMFVGLCWNSQPLRHLQGPGGYSPDLTVTLLGQVLTLLDDNIVLNFDYFKRHCEVMQQTKLAIIPN